MPDEEIVPDFVYHYTSMETLLKIMDSKSIWATNIRYLNDVLERQHCLSAVQKRIPGAIRDTGLLYETRASWKDSKHSFPKMKTHHFTNFRLWLPSQKIQTHFRSGDRTVIRAMESVSDFALIY